MNYIVEEQHNGERLDKFLVGAMENVSRTDVQKLIDAGEVKVGASKVSKNFRVETDVVPGTVFYSWVFGFGGDVVINGPVNVKEEYKQLVQKVADKLNA